MIQQIVVAKILHSVQWDDKIKVNEYFANR